MVMTKKDILRLYQRLEPITSLTCYDASFAQVCEQAGVEVLLVGDSLGNVVQGQRTTLPVTLEQMIYHTQAVCRGCTQPFVMTDLPFGTYQKSPQQAFEHAVLLMQAGAQMVKLEGGAVMAETVAFLVERGVPVCGHIGLQPQSVHQLGGFAMQGKDDSAARRLLDDGLALQQAGADIVVLESIPAQLGQAITERLAIPTIGIGAGHDCSGQILVLYDLLGLSPVMPPFARDFLSGRGSIKEALAAYVQAVKQKTFPA
jgi:3-methyl-2-oxobutanoate hydroxymethyltransferase